MGTGGTRAVLIDRNGRVVASAASEHAPVRSERIGWAEQDPEDWWRAATRSVRHALTQADLRGHEIGCHTFRATGITAYLKNGGTLEKAAQMANHASTRTTQLYDRRRDELSLDEVERIRV